MTTRRTIPLEPIEAAWRRFGLADAPGTRGTRLLVWVDNDAGSGDTYGRTDERIVRTDERSDAYEKARRIIGLARRKGRLLTEAAADWLCCKVLCVHPTAVFDDWYERTAPGTDPPPARW